MRGQAISCVIMCAALLSRPAPGWSPPQTGTSRASDEQRRLLDVRRRQIELSSARAALKRIQDLYRDGLVPRTELDRAQTAVETAQLNYQEALLSVLSLEPHLTVKDAVKYQGENGRKFIRLTIENLTPVFDDEQFRMLSDFEGADSIPESLRRRDVRDVFVSIRAVEDPGNPSGSLARGATIALPYEGHLTELRHGTSQSMEFELLRDAEVVMVVCVYKDQCREQVVLLRHAYTAAVVSVAAAQASQEADLGQQATFDLRLDRSSVAAEQFQLRVVNLPPQVSYRFIDLASEARISQVSFAAGVSRQSIGLRLFLPEMADERLPVDKPIEFWVLAVSSAEAARFQQERLYSAQEIERSRAGRVALTIIPRGVGKVQVSAANLYSEIQPGETLETRLMIRNTGTRRLDKVNVIADHPQNWRVQLDPDVVPALDIGREVGVMLRILPPQDAPVGDYEVRIRTESYAYNRQVPSEDKIFRVAVRARPNMWGSFLLAAGLVVLMLGIIALGIKLSRG